MDQNLDLGLAAAAPDRAESSVLRSILQKWPLVLGIGALGMVLAILFSVLGPASYVATTSIVVEDPRVSDASASSALNPERFVADQVEILRSHTVARRAADILADSGLEGPLPTAQDLLPDAGKLVVTSPQDSNVVLISLTNERDDVALEGVGAALAAYEETRVAEAERSSSSALEQLDARIADLDGQLNALRDEIQVAIPNDVQDALEARVLETLQSLMELQDRLLTTTSPAEIAQINASITALQAAEATTEGLLSTFAPANLAGLLDQQSALITRRAELTSLRDEIAVGSELAATGITFVSPAAPATRADLSVPVAGVLGLIIGLIIGSVIARWMALRERRLSDYAEPGRVLAAPLLADVPDFSSERLTSPIPVRDHPASATAETFRFAASNMAVRLKALEMKCVSVVSGTVGDGKSTVAANLGFAATGLGSDGSRVLLIDADFTDQTLTNMLGVPLDSVGLTEVAISNAPLSFAAQALTWTGPGQIFLLPRGELPVNTQSFFWSDDVRRVIEEAREDFDLVIIDTPPLLQVAYAGNLARLADSSVVVARHRGNSAELAEVRDRLTLLARQSIGYVYNKAPMRGWMSEDARPAARGKTDLGLAIEGDVNR